ncbi:peroxidase-like protein [Mytilus galloprovincialis]|uniref:peroxidase-like protein n=1 Tax=Mytilus galloprovincialis TaxID=29158 RepID=UPI003F7BF331
MSLFSRVKAAPVRVSSMARSADISEIASDIITRRMSITMGDLQSLGMSQRFVTAMDSNCALKNIMCNPDDIYRQPNGVCNNLKNPMWGSSITPQPRFIPPHYGDGKNIGIIPRYLSVSGEPLPNPRHISTSVHNGGISPPRGCQFTVLLTFFGQFVDHDVISTPTKEDREGVEFRCCHGNMPILRRPECFPFGTPPGEFNSTCMHFVRSEIAPTVDCLPGPRNQMNQASSFLDLSVTYGSTHETEEDLVDFSTGKLYEGSFGLLPQGEGECIENTRCFRSGDQRHTENPFLNTIQTLFMREHNRIADILHKINLHWNGERIYKETRKLLTGIYQHIVFTEFLPALLGDELTSQFGLLPKPVGFNTLYNDNVDAGTRNAFGAAAFRIGHTFIGSLIGSSDMNFNEMHNIPLENEFFNPRTIYDRKNFGVEGILRWMLNQFQSQSDRFLTPTVRNRLFQTRPGNGFDLGALNIQRGRDHGLPSYNSFRRHCGLQPAWTFIAGPTGLVDHDKGAALSLQKIYKHPDDIDLFPGGLSETPHKGSLVGPTFGCLIGLQFLMYKTGDRFYYENKFPQTGFTSEQLNIIKQQSLSSLLCRNTDIHSVQPKAFVSPLPGCKERYDMIIQLFRQRSIYNLWY